MGPCPRRAMQVPPTWPGAPRRARRPRPCCRGLEQLDCVARMVDQPGDTDQRHHDGGADRGAQRARRLGELNRRQKGCDGMVADVLEHEQAEPRRGAEDTTTAAIQRGEARLEERGAPIEGGPGAAQHEQHAEEQRGLPRRRSLGRTGHTHADHDQERRRVVGGVEPAGEPLRETSRPARHAAGEV